MDTGNKALFMIVPVEKLRTRSFLHLIILVLFGRVTKIPLEQECFNKNRCEA